MNNALGHDFTPSGVCIHCKASTLDALTTQTVCRPPVVAVAPVSVASRADIYALIDDERDKQDANWPQRAQYQFNAPHILILEEKIARLRGLWYGAKTEEFHAEFVKIAAIAVRALEEVSK